MCFYYRTPSETSYNYAAFMSYTESSTEHHYPFHQHQPQSTLSLQNPPTSLANGTNSSLPVVNRKYSTGPDWDINDTHVPHILPGQFNGFDEWVDGHHRCVYPPGSEEARKHTSGWAMRNTNNHNVNILKKSCLGVLVCSLGCRTAAGDSVHLRPAICDKARRKQLGKLCPNRLVGI